MLSSTLDIFARREIDFEVGPFLGAQFGEPAIEDRFRGRDELENDRFALAEVVTDRRDHCRQLHAEKKLAEEALLCGFEAGARRGLGAAVERGVLEAIDNGGQFERPFHVAVDDRLSRGRDNVKERGSDVDSPNAGRCCCALF